MDDVAYVAQLLSGGGADAQPSTSGRRAAHPQQQGGRHADRGRGRRGGQGGGGGRGRGQLSSSASDGLASSSGRAGPATGCRCDLCGCHVGGDWDTHLRGIRHRRQLLSVKHFGGPGHTVVTDFELAAGLDTAGALHRAYGGRHRPLQRATPAGPALAQAGARAAAQAVTRRLAHYSGVGGEYVRLQERYLATGAVAAAVPGVAAQLNAYAATRGGVDVEPEAARGAVHCEDVRQLVALTAALPSAPPLPSLHLQRKHWGHVRQRERSLAPITLRLRSPNEAVRCNAGGRLPNLPVAFATLEQLLEQLSRSHHATSIRSIAVELVVNDAETTASEMAGSRLRAALGRLNGSVEAVTKRLLSLRAFTLLLPTGMLRSNEVPCPCPASELREACRAVRLAVAMGWHSRLGAGSLLPLLPQPLLKDILDAAAPLEPCRVLYT